MAELRRIDRPDVGRLGGKGINLRPNSLLTYRMGGGIEPPGGLIGNALSRLPAQITDTLNEFANVKTRIDQETDALSMLQIEEFAATEDARLDAKIEAATPNTETEEALPSWVDDHEQAVREYADKMPLSQEARAVMETKIKGKLERVRIHADKEFLRRKIRWDGQVADSRMNQAVEDGDYVNAGKWYDAATAFLGPMDQTREVVVSRAARNNMIAFGDSLNLAESTEWLNKYESILKLDKERIPLDKDNPDGPAISRGDLRAVTRFVEQKRANMEIETQDAFAADVLAGKIITEEEIQQRTDITQKTKNGFVKILRNVQAKKANEQAKAEKAAEVDRKQQQKDAGDRLEFEIMTFEFSSDPTARAGQYATFNQRIYDEFLAANPATAKQLKRQLNESLKAAEKPDSSYKKSAAYQYGAALIDQMKAQGKFYAQKSGKWYGTNPTTGKGDEGTMKLVEKMVKLDLDRYLQAHPDTPEEKVKTLVETMTADYNKTMVDGLADRSVIHSNAIKSMAPREGRTGTINGMKVIFKNGAWTYAE